MGGPGHPTSATRGIGPEQWYTTRAATRATHNVGPLRTLAVCAGAVVVIFSTDVAFTVVLGWGRDRT